MEKKTGIRNTKSASTGNAFSAVFAFVFLMSAATVVFSWKSIAADPESSESAAAPEAAPETKQPSKKKKKDRYQKSRLTSDRSEMTSDRRKLLLATGEDRTVDLSFDANVEKGGIAVGNPKVVLVKLAQVGEKKQIIFQPASAGETTVTVRDTEGNLRLIFDVRVTGSDLLDLAAQIRGLLRDIEGIEIKIVGKKVVIDGEVLVPSDYGRLVNVILDKSYADNVLNLVTLSPVAMQILSQKIQTDVNVFAPNVRTRVVNGLIWLEGSVDNIDQAKRAKLVAELYVPEVKPANPIDKDVTAQRFAARPLVQSFLVINPPPPKKQDKLIRLTIHFVELSKDYNKLFGFKWQPGFTADDPKLNLGTAASGSPGGSSGGFAATISSLFPTLQSAQNAGFARILKTGTLIVRNGQPANLLDETEIPFAVSTGNGQVASQTARVGTKVSATPLILGQSDDIQLDLLVAQNNLTGRSGAIPIVTSHQIDTKIFVRSSESAAVAGLTSADVQTSFNKDDPREGTFTGGSSPLFTLLRSKNYTKKKGQFVIFVTPQIIENASDGTDDLRKNFRIKVK